MLVDKVFRKLFHCYGAGSFYVGTVWGNLVKTLRQVFFTPPHCERTGMAWHTVRREWHFQFKACHSLSQPPPKLFAQSSTHSGTRMQMRARSSCNVIKLIEQKGRNYFAFCCCDTREQLHTATSSQGTSLTCVFELLLNALKSLCWGGWYGALNSVIVIIGHLRNLYQIYKIILKIE